jgi:nitrogen fixation protein FixH
MNAETSQTFTGRHMLILMLAFFGVIIVANLTMVYFAMHSWTGLVVKNSYVASQEFDATTARLEKAASDTRAKVDFTSGKLRLQLTDGLGHARYAKNVTIKIGRPSHDGEDQVISLSATGNGRYETVFPLAKGQWAGEATAELSQHELWQRPLYLVVTE